MDVFQQQLEQAHQQFLLLSDVFRLQLDLKAHLFEAPDDVVHGLFRERRLQIVTDGFGFQHQIRCVLQQGGQIEDQHARQHFTQHLFLLLSRMNWRSRSIGTNSPCGTRLRDGKYCSTKLSSSSLYSFQSLLSIEVDRRCPSLPISPGCCVRWTAKAASTVSGLTPLLLPAISS